MPVFGQGFGVRLAEGLDAADAGVDWTQEQQRRARQAAIDKENLRGAGIRNDNSRNQEIRTNDSYGLEKDALRLGNESRQQGIDARDLTLSEAGREEGRRRENQQLQGIADRGELKDTIGQQNYDAEKRGSDLPRVLAENDERSAVANTNASEARRQGKSNRLTAADRTDLEKLRAHEAKLDGEIDWFRKDAERGTMADTLSTEEEDRRSRLEYQAVWNLYQMAKLNPREALNRLNSSPLFDVTGAVKLDLDGGRMRAYDAAGNLVMDNSEFDEAGNVQPVPFDYETDMFSDENAYTMLPKDMQQFVNRSRSGSTRKRNPNQYSKQVSQHVDTLVRRQYGYDEDAALASEDSARIEKVSAKAMELMGKDESLSYIEAVDRVKDIDLVEDLEDAGVSMDEVEQMYQAGGDGMDRRDFYEYVVQYLASGGDATGAGATE